MKLPGWIAVFQPSAPASHGVFRSWVYFLYLSCFFRRYLAPGVALINHNLMRFFRPFEGMHKPLNFLHIGFFLISLFAYLLGLFL